MVAQLGYAKDTQLGQSNSFKMRLPRCPYARDPIVVVMKALSPSKRDSENISFLIHQTNRAGFRFRISDHIDCNNLPVGRLILEGLA